MEPVKGGWSCRGVALTVSVDDRKVGAEPQQGSRQVVELARGLQRIQAAESGQHALAHVPALASALICR